MHWNNFLTALVIGLVPITAYSQATQSTTEGKTEFVPHWFMQVQAGAAHTRGEAKFGDLISPAAAFTVVINLHRFGDCVLE